MRLESNLDNQYALNNETVNSTKPDMDCNNYIVDTDLDKRLDKIMNDNNLLPVKLSSDGPFNCSILNSESINEENISSIFKLHITKIHNKLQF